MILVDRPYVSEFLKETSREHHIPIIKTAEALALGIQEVPYLLEERKAVQQLKASHFPRLYTTSENSLGWIARNLAFSDLPEKINLFKNKVQFRRLLEPLTPDFFFREVTWRELDELSIDEIPMPFVIKPAVGFFSMGVQKVTQTGEWDVTRKKIKSEIIRAADLYPKEVLDATSFIIEGNIEGKEFAVDAYFDAAGEPVILGIFHHPFSSGEDVSDRVYFTSKTVVEENLEPFTRFLDTVGRLTGVRNFPVHAELRRTSRGRILPIEINPMRFGGWCSTPDLTAHAYGINPYLMYFRQQRPGWETLIKGKGGMLYCIIVLDNSTGVDGSKISGFDYERLLKHFEHPLELRKIDYKTYPVFGFVFTEISERNRSELDWILKSDLREFVSEK